MKKIVLAGMTSLALASAPILGAFADAPQHDVTVGEVDQTIYSIDIDWGDMTFDWKYDSATSSFNFKPGKTNTCAGTQVTSNQYLNAGVYELQSDGNLYSDSECTTLAEGELTTGMYYTKTYTNFIQVTDTTTNGRIATVTATFTPESKYSWVSGSFGNKGYHGCSYEEIVAGSCEYGYSEGFEEVSSSPLMFAASLTLSKTSNPTQPELIAASDKIGTITINISDGTE